MDARRLYTELTPEALMTYVYDECEPGERERVDVHLATCRACAAELESLQAVRGTLQAWTPPEQELHVRIVLDKDGQPGWWRTMLTPTWGLAAAATLVLVVGAAIAGIEPGRSGSVEVQSQLGAVKLLGEVPYRHLRVEVVQAARRVHGVRTIEDLLSVRAPAAEE